jgi:hypothetical protein
MPDETVPTPPSPADVLDSRLAFLRAELASLDELVAAPAFDDKNQNARLTFCVAHGRARLGRAGAARLRITGLGPVNLERFIRKALVYRRDVNAVRRGRVGRRVARRVYERLTGRWLASCSDRRSRRSDRP